MKLNRTLSLIGLAGVFAAAPASAQFISFIGNPAGNSSDWTAAVLARGGAINSSIDFETAPLGTLGQNFYPGVTISGIGGFDQVAFGAGPGQGNVFTDLLNVGEGQHPASNYLLSSTNGSVTFTFDTPIFAFGLFVVDFFNPEGRTFEAMEAFRRAGGALSAGGIVAPQFNFQSNNQYFMGFTFGTESVVEVTFVHNGTNTIDLVGLDNIVFARAPVVSEPPPGLTPVPEPATYGLVGALVLGSMVALRRRKANQAADV